MWIAERRMIVQQCSNISDRAGYSKPFAYLESSPAIFCGPNLIIRAGQPIRVRARVMFAGRDDCSARTSRNRGCRVAQPSRRRSDVDASVVSVDQKTSVSRCTRCELFSRSDQRILVPRKDRLIDCTPSCILLAEYSLYALACWGTQRSQLRSSHSSRVYQRVQNGTMTYHCYYDFILGDEQRRHTTA